MAKRDDDIGKWFEGQTQDLLNQARDNLLCRYLRLYDTRSAGSYMPEQPGDFLVGAATGGWLIECKASAKHNSLRGCLSSNVEPHQAAALRLWHRFQPAIVLFCAMKDGQRVEVWDGETVGHARAEGERLKLTQRMAHLEWSEFPDWLFQQFTVETRDDCIQ